MNIKLNDMTGLDIATSDRDSLNSMSKTELENHINWLESRMKMAIRQDHFNDAAGYDFLIAEAKQVLNSKNQ